MVGYIYKSAANRRSGSSMQKMPHRGSLSRSERARRVIPGFPWEGKFKERHEVEEYLSGDKIECLICGKMYVMLAPHAKRIHGVDAEDYKKRFGIPQKYGISCEAFKAKKRLIMTNYVARDIFSKRKSPNIWEVRAAVRNPFTLLRTRNKQGQLEPIKNTAQPDPAKTQPD